MQVHKLQKRNFLEKMHHNISLLLPLLSLQPATYCILFDLGTTLIKCAICKQTHSCCKVLFSINPYGI